MSSKYNNENNKRSKSWKRSDEEMLQSTTHLRVQFRKEGSRFGSNYNLLAENGSRSRIGLNALCGSNNNNSGYQSTRGAGGGGTGATGETSNMSINHYSNNYGGQ